jgi:hypothetical protein
LREWENTLFYVAVNAENRGAGGNRPGLAWQPSAKLPYNPAMNVECTTGPLKICGSCRRAWPTWDSFVLDPAVRLLGLQSEISKTDINLLVFEHGCGSSISTLSRRLRHLLPEPEPGDPPALLMGTDQCRGHCLHLEDLEACDACSNPPDREPILLVQRMKRGIRLCSG